ncbi:hypothetical protein BT96DRAFT_816169 [Gymnopus androsaceus JB14]|uniref:CxC6 like cysteine cluster associated with KDZ domain-containing protein n=1 Tax=Gymnopus androsaceus JB14 TaxID=1447944 RepID=A0A6A4I194_9AGAR|nr:hypothetical protein BT96DRAFT_816169 [Gymnopus androsaceus JB14]
MLDCSTQYYPNYYIHNKWHIYYEETPAAIQVAKHHYVEKELAELFVVQMVMSWYRKYLYKQFYRTSATNAAQIYNTIFPIQSNISTSPLADEHVWDAFTILSLIKEYQSRNAIFDVPDHGEQCHQFVEAMEERNQQIAQFGQEDIHHYCDRCMRITEVDGRQAKIHAMVLNGICIGRPHCSFQGPIPCTNKLPSSKAHFCEEHDCERFVCAVTTCHEPVANGFSTCKNPDHHLLESNRAARHTAFFQLKHVLARQGIFVPASSTDPVDVLDEIEQPNGPEHQGPSATFVGDLALIDCPDKKDQPVKLKAVFGHI